MSFFIVLLSQRAIHFPSLSNHAPSIGLLPRTNECRAAQIAALTCPDGPRGLVDYFCVAGLNSELGLEPELFSEDTGLDLPPIRRPYRAFVNDHFPDERDWNKPFDAAGILMLCFPQGLLLRWKSESRCVSAIPCLCQINRFIWCVASPRTYTDLTNAAHMPVNAGSTQSLLYIWCHLFSFIFPNMVLCVRIECNLSLSLSHVSRKVYSDALLCNDKGGWDENPWRHAHLLRAC